MEGLKLFIRSTSLFKSGLTKNLYDEFLNSHQLNKADMQSSPYVYVDNIDGSIRLLTKMMVMAGEEIVALTIGTDGEIRMLSTEN